ncbi:MAG: PAS domain S-box protein [Chloroflexota bacterium]|nr:PAS domain S-box protein [Chloroflexota bacterium]
MNDRRKTKAQLIMELEETRKQLLDFQAVSEITTKPTNGGQSQEYKHGQQLLVEREARLDRLSKQLREETEKRKRAQTTLIRVMMEQEHIMETIPDIICTVDPNGCLVTWNRRLEMVTGLSAEQLMEKPLAELLIQEDRLTLNEALANGIETSQSLQIENHLVTKDDTLAVYQWNTGTLRDENANVIGIIGVGRDITAQKLAEDARKEAELRYTAIFENPLQMVYINDEHGRFLEANDCAMERFGYTREDIGKVFFQDIVHPEDLPKAFQAVADVMETGRMGDPVELRLVLPNGEIAWIETFGIPLERGDGEYKGLGIAQDVTQRKRTEEALRDSERLYRLLAENATDVIWTMDLNLQYTYVSPSITRLRGFTPEEVKTHRVIDTMTPESAEYATQIFIEEIEKERIGIEEPFRSRLLELELNRKDGSTVWTEITMSFLRDEDGQPTGILGVTRDISERRKAEEAIQEAERRYKAIFNNPLQLVYLVDLNGNVLDMNDSTKELLEYSTEELVKLSFADVLHPEDLNSALAALNENMFTGGLERPYEVRILTKSREVIWVETLGVPLYRNGEVYAGLGIGHDISERKRAEEQLKASEERYRLLVDSAPDPIVLVDLTGTIMSCNTAIEKVTGFHPEELEGEWFQDLVTLDPYDLPAFTTFFSDLLEGRQVDDFEMKFIHRDGSIRWTSVKVRILYRDEQPSSILVIARDVTQRVISQRELQRRSEALERSNRELEQFAYIASHDLQEPLRMVASYVQLLERRYKGRLDEDADEFISYAVDGANRMQRMINDLLTYSRVGTRGKAFEPTDCESVLDTALANLKLTIEENNAVITHDPLPTIMADSSQLIQLFQNLIANAIKFHGNKVPYVHARATRNNGEWVFSVHDNGIGIDPEYKERVFVIFQRLHTHEEYPGTGIGLAVCKRIVERHQGRIWVESTPGEGTDFFFTVPAEGEEPS